MLRIAICDDTPEDRLDVFHHTKSYFEKREMEVEIDSYSDAKELLLREHSYDLYLMDVLIPNMTGLEAAKRLQSLSERPVIIFITSSMEAAVEGYRVNAAGFILKPVQEADFEETFSRVISMYLKPQTAAITITHNRVPLTLPLRKIVYFENRLHRVSILTSDGELLTSSHKLTGFQEMLSEYSQFLRCHQSFLVNLDYVERMEDNSFLLQNQQLVPISRNFYKQSKNAYYHYLLK